MTNLFQDGNFTSAAGLNLPFKIECDALTENDIQTLAKLIASRVKFSVVFGVPTGGSRLASALFQYSSWNNNDPVLIVDDVLTTGKSIEEFRHNITSVQHVIGIVIFARGECPDWVTPVFEMKIR